MHKKLVLIRTINEFIDSKNGRLLAPTQRRIGIDSWIKFENLVIDILKDMNVTVLKQPEHPNQEDWNDSFDLKIYCHKNRVDIQNLNSKSLFYMQMHKKSLFTLDPSGWGFLNSKKSQLKESAISADPILAETFYETYIQNLKAKKDTKINLNSNPDKKIFPQFSSDLPSEYYLVPLQVSRDYVINNFSTTSVPDFILQIGQWAKKSDIPFVIKPHPFNLKDVLVAKALKEVVDHKYVFLSQNHIFDLIDQSQSVWLINSGVGFESIYFLKPVITFGQCDYEDIVFKGTLKNFDENIELLNQFSDKNILMYKQFLYYYLNRHSYDLELNPEERLQSYLAQELGV